LRADATLLSPMLNDPELRKANLRAATWIERPGMRFARSPGWFVIESRANQKSGFPRIDVANRRSRTLSRLAALSADYVRLGDFSL